MHTIGIVGEAVVWISGVFAYIQESKNLITKKAHTGFPDHIPMIWGVVNRIYLF